jgi:hypothetical protein
LNLIEVTPEKRGAAELVVLSVDGTVDASAHTGDILVVPDHRPSGSRYSFDTKCRSSE